MGVEGAAKALVDIMIINYCVVVEAMPMRFMWSKQAEANAGTSKK